MNKNTLSKLLQKPYIMISALIFVILNIAVAGTTLFYSANVERLVYSETFRHLEVTRDVKHHALQLYFSDHYAHLYALANSAPVSNLIRTLPVPDSRIFMKKQNDPIPRFGSDDVQAREVEANRLIASMKIYGFQNAALVDRKDAEVLFSTDPELSPGMSLTQEPQRSLFYGLWEKTVRYRSLQLADVRRFPDKNEPCLCLAAPVFFGMEFRAVLMVKLPVDGVNEIMHFRSGMGRTEESYAVGQDHLMRSDSYLDPDRYSVRASFANPDEGRVDTKAVAAALQGKEGHAVITDYRGIPVLSAYRPLYLDGFVWAVVSEIDTEEVEKKISALREPIYVIAVVLYGVITLLSYFVIRRIIAVSIVRPLKASYRRTRSFQEIIENSLNEIYLFRPDDLRFTYINRGAARNTGYTPEAMQQMTLPQVIPEFTEQKCRRMLQPLSEGKEEMLTFEGVHRRRDGSHYDVSVRIQLMEIEGEERFVAIANDITERKRAQKEKELYCDMAHHDHLTGIYNRKHFDEVLERELSRFKRYGEQGSLVMFDIDHFKEVNDRFGHDLGDEVLKSVTRRVKRTLRESDVFARWGGEEFVLLLPHTDFHGACEKAETLRKSIGETVFETVGGITCSFGVVDLREGESREALFKRLDGALYRAKKEGRDRTVGCPFEEG